MTLENKAEYLLELAEEAKAEQEWEDWLFSEEYQEIVNNHEHKDPQGEYNGN